MSPINQSIQPYYYEFLRCAICSHDFEYENSLYRPITLPTCGHTMCGQCIDIIRNQTKCPQDQVSFGINNTSLDQLPTNYPLLIILYESLKLPEDNEERYGQCLSYMKLDDETKSYFNRTQTILGEIAILIKPIINDKECQSILSRPMIRKIFSLLNSQYIDREGRLKALKAARSLGERTCIDFILHHQNPQQLTANLWSAVRSRGCQFLGPAMQEEVLKLILLALEDGSALSRKVLVLFVVQKLAPQYPRASKTSVGHVVQLLYRASCFKVQKREEESSLMQLKSEFRNYENLRREHDSQIIQIAMEAGLRISPEQWSSLLYGDTQHKSSMQSIIDKLSTPASFSQAIQEFLIVLQRAGDSSKHLSYLKTDFEYLSQIDLGINEQQQILFNDNQQQDNSNWLLIIQALQSVKTVLQSLIEFNWQESKTNYFNKNTNHHHHRSYDLSSTTFTSSTSCSSPMTVSPLGGSSTTSEYHLQPLHPPTSQHNQVKYKVSMCRDFVQKQSCPRGVHCTFAHSKAEMDKYRAKNRHQNGSTLSLTSSNTNIPPPPPPPPASSGPLPIFASTNGANLIRPIPPPILPLWNPQQQQQQQQQTQHLIQEMPQQHHHHHYYHPSQIPPSILQMHGHPTTTSYENQQQQINNNNTNNSSQIPVIAAAAQAILEQNNAAAAAFAANAFYRFQQQQQQQQPFHQTQPMIGQQQQQPLLSRPCLPPTNSNLGQQSSNPLQQRPHNFTDSRFSSLSDQHNSHQSTAHFPHIEDLRLPPVLPLNGNNSTDNININPRNYSVLQTIAAKNDDNLSYFPLINNPNNINRQQQQQQQTFLNGSNNNTNNNNNGLFTDLLTNNNPNPISTLSTNTFLNNRQQQPYKSFSTITYPQQLQQQQIRNDENVFHNNHQHATSFDDDDYSLINVSNNGGGGGGGSSNESSFFYFGSGNAHATAAYNFYHPNSPLGGNGHSLKA